MIGRREASDLGVEIGDPAAPVREPERLGSVAGGWFGHRATLRSVGRHRNGASTAVGILVASVLAGCVFERPLPTHDQAFHEGSGFDGVLHVDGDCVWVEDANVEIADKKAFNVLWPAGYRARGQPLEIVDATGAVAAREGDLISFGIGAIEQLVVPGCPGRPTALVTEIVDVNGQPVQSPTPFVDRPILQ